MILNGNKNILTDDQLQESNLNQRDETIPGIQKLEPRLLSETDEQPTYRSKGRQRGVSLSHRSKLDTYRNSSKQSQEKIQSLEQSELRARYNPCSN